MKTKDNLSSKQPNNNERRNFISRLITWIMGIIFIFPFQKAHAETDNVIETFSGELQTVNNNLIDKVNLAELSESGRRIKIVSGVIRNDGTGFQLLEGFNHSSINIKNVQTDNTRVTINYGFRAKNILGFSCSPSHLGIKDNFDFGASVGDTHAELYIYKKPVNMSAYIKFNGTSWEVVSQTGNANFIVTSFKAGYLNIRHNDIGIDFIGNATSYLGELLPSIVSASKTETIIKFFDYNGTLQTTPSTKMRVLLNRFSDSGPVDPTQYQNKALWINGIFELY